MGVHAQGSTGRGAVSSAEVRAFHSAQRSRVRGEPSKEESLGHEEIMGKLHGAFGHYRVVFSFLTPLVLQRDGPDHLISFPYIRYIGGMIISWFHWDILGT